jgi:hypothetical protein
MRNLYTVTATSKTADPPAPLHVVAPTQIAAIRKAQKHLFGSPANVPPRLKWEAEEKAGGIIL